MDGIYSYSMSGTRITLEVLGFYAEILFGTVRCRWSNTNSDRLSLYSIQRFRLFLGQCVAGGHFVTGSVFMPRFLILLGQCVASGQSVTGYVFMRRF